MFPRTRALATLGRSVQLLRSFRFEQTEPARFYQPLAEDTAQLLESLWADTHSADVPTVTSADIPVDVHSPLAGLRILDVGGGPGYFHEAFAQREATYVAVEPDVGEMAAAGIVVPAAIRASGMALPLRDDAFDLVYSSNVAEHVPDPWLMADEMLRVTKPGGLMVLSYTIWLGPFGGHETGLWEHYVGGEFARRRYEHKHGHAPKNSFGTSLFAVSCADGLRWAKRQQQLGRGVVELCFPRYHPQWAWQLVRIPVLREFAVSNLVVVVRKTQPL